MIRTCLGCHGSPPIIMLSTRFTSHKTSIRTRQGWQRNTQKDTQNRHMLPLLSYYYECLSLYARKSKSTQIQYAGVPSHTHTHAFRQCENLFSITAICTTVLLHAVLQRDFLEFAFAHVLLEMFLDYTTELIRMNKSH